MQTESKFYGALDGAMKFVKGDAIAGIVITAVNILGGFVIGMLVAGLSAAESMSKYTLLTVGDGLLSQIPALLSALAAGLVVTRVTREESTSLAADLFDQLGQIQLVKVLVGIGFGICAFVPALPTLPFAIFSLCLLVSALLSRSREREESKCVAFSPKSPSLLEVVVGPEAGRKLSESGCIESHVEEFREQIYDETGLILLRPEFRISAELDALVEIHLRGLKVEQINLADDNGDCSSIVEVFRILKETVERLSMELLDDVMTRRLLDQLDREAPELVAAVVPGAVTVTQLTVILKGLISEGVSISNFDVILQALAESAPKAASERELLEAARVALKRVIAAKFVNQAGVIRIISVDPVIDLAFQQAEREGTSIDPHLTTELESKIRNCPTDGLVIAVSRGARRLIRESLIESSIKVPVLAFEEVPDGVSIEVVEKVLVENDQTEEIDIESVAA